MNAFLQNVVMAWRALKGIVSLPQYFLLTFGVASVVFVFSIWFPNLGLIRDVIFSVSLTLSQKILFLWYSIGAIFTNFSVFSAGLVVFVSVLFGLNIAVTTYFYKKRLAFQRASGFSFAGMLASFIGVGCTSCGSIVLTAFIGVGTTASILGFLPLQGQEFNIVGLILLVWTLYYTAKKSIDPLVCGVKQKI